MDKVLKVDMDIPEVESPFKPLMAQGHGSPIRPIKFQQVDGSPQKLITDETFYGTLFCICDKQKVGSVRVSKLLDILLTFQALNDDSQINSTQELDSLEPLKDLLDPCDIDPLVNLDTFKDAVHKYLELRNHPELNTDANLNTRLCSPLKPTLIRNLDSSLKSMLGNESRPSFTSIMDLSNMSRSGSIEGVGGNASVIDPTDLQTEISELKFQILKLSDECLGLKQQNSVFQDENLQLLVAKDELEKRLAQRDLSQERIKQLLRELEESRATISSAEDLTSVLSSRIQRLERDYFEVEMQNKDLKRDYDTAMGDFEKCYSRLKLKNEKIQRMKLEFEELDKGWSEKIKWMENQVTDLHETIEELTRTNNVLRKEKFELENNLVDITGNQLAQLNNSISSPRREENSSRSAFSFTSDVTPSDLRKSLQEEIAATIQQHISQETMTDPDENSTPINDDGGLDEFGIQTCPTCNRRKEYENVTPLRKLGSLWGTNISKNNNDETKETVSIGVIPEGDIERMKKYAYDPVRRSTEREADILTGPEWRTLRVDLDKANHDTYRKRFAEEEGNDIEGGLAIEGVSQKPSDVPDLQEEVEEYLECFPNLAEQLFIHLDLLKKSDECPTDTELNPISERFNHLALTFQTEHIALSNRRNTQLSERDCSKRKMHEIIHSMTENLSELEVVAKKESLSEEVTEIFRSLMNLPADLHLYTNILSKTSRRVGMMDVQARLYKMIEVMVLYVHILRNLCAEKEKDFQNAKNLLDEHNITFTGIKSVVISNNNNNDRVSLNDSQYSPLKESESERIEDRRPIQILQHLLGPKKCSFGFDFKIQESLISKNNEFSPNAIIRYFSNAYETLRCELVWPWNWEETWKGTKHSFSVMLMFIGFAIICRSLLPIVNADDPPQVTDLASIFSKHGDLDHVTIPPL